MRLDSDLLDKHISESEENIRNMREVQCILERFCDSLHTAHTGKYAVIPNGLTLDIHFKYKVDIDKYDFSHYKDTKGQRLRIVALWTKELT